MTVAKKVPNPIGGYMPSLTISQARRAIDMYLAGKPISLIADLIGCNAATVAKALDFRRPYDCLPDLLPAETVVRLKRERQQRRAIGPGNVERARWMRRLLQRGVAAARIAEMAGVSYNTVYKLREGITYEWLD